MLAKQVVKGVSLLLAGRIFANMLGFISTIVVARLLVPEDFGLVALATSAFAIISSLVELPTGTALIQLKDLSDHDFDTAWTLGLLKGLAVCGMMLLAAWPMAFIFEDQRLIGLMAALAIYPIILGFRNSYFEGFAREMKFSREVVLDIGSKLASIAASIGIAFVFRSYWALPAGVIASGIVATLVSFLLMPRRPRLSLKSFHRIFHFSVWLGASSVVNQLNWQSDPLIMGRILGPALLGQVSVGGQFVGRIDEVTRPPLFRSLFSAFSRIQDDPERMRTAYLSSQAFCVAGLLPVGLGISAVAIPLIPLILGDKWHIAGVVVAFCGVMSATMALTAPAQPLSLALGRTRTLFERDAIGLLIRVSCIVVGILTYGLTGLLIGMLLASFVLLCINVSLVRLFIGVSAWRQCANVARSLAAGALMWGVVFWMARFVPTSGPWDARAASVATLVGVGAVVYGGTHLLLWRLNGCPNGVEQKLFAMASGFLNTLGAKRRRA